ncbi:MAG: GNAT family N-acetyltransferase [candidate division Zixibacteria bacterium]|nr:GNAT family N-acetyltransferase [candidate division Zixibacteria bacterium]
MIETRRLILRQMREDDAEALFGIFSDPIAMTYFGVVFDRSKMDTWVRKNLEHERQHGFSLRSVILKDNGVVIGNCGLETDEIEGRTIVGIGFDFNRSYWGRGYATEAARAVLEYGFSRLGFDSIFGWIDPQNKPSQRVAKRIGMSLERYVMRGPKKYALYGIKRKDWIRGAESHHE